MLSHVSSEKPLKDFSAGDDVSWPPWWECGELELRKPGMDLIPGPRKYHQLCDLGLQTALL